LKQRLCFVICNYVSGIDLHHDFLQTIYKCLTAGHSVDIYTLEWRGDQPKGVTVHCVKKQGASLFRQYAHFARSVHEARVKEQYDCVIGFNPIPDLDIYYAKEPCIGELVQGIRRVMPRYQQRLQFERSILSLNSHCQVISSSLRVLRAIKMHYRTPACRLHWLSHETCEQTQTNIQIHSLQREQSLGDGLGDYLLDYLQQPKSLKPFGANAAMAYYGCESTVFDRIMDLEGEVVRHKEGRKTLRFEYNGQGFYAKLHRGIGLGEWLKNWLSLRAPIVSARTEWQAIAKLKSLKLPTLEAVAFSERGVLSFKRESFLLTRELTKAESLETYCRPWRDNPPSKKERNSLIRQLANYVKTIHDEGWFHRDLYLCHFLKALNEEDKYYLIDLHRMQHKRLTRRWRIKDLSALYYSAFEYGVNRRDALYFIRCYTGGKSPRVQKKLWQCVERKAHSLQQKALRKGVG
jgi:heptose I phosphotransferase